LASKKTLKQVAKDVREAYSMYRREIHPKYNPHPRWKNIWPKVAEVLVENEIQPTRFVEIQFRTMTPFPMPNHLTGVAAMKRYKEYGPESDKETERQFIYEVDHLTSHLKISSPRRLLEREPSTLSPLFRYCMATKFNMEDLLEDLRERAIKQLVLDSSSYAIYEEIIPDELKQKYSQEWLGEPDGEEG
jgi:hypothetical protein